MTNSALDKQIGIKVQGNNPYTEIGNIIDDWCENNYYGSVLVTMSIDGRVRTEYLAFDGNDMEFVWERDWWEGERDVILIGFRIIDDVVFYGYPNSKGCDNS